MAAGVYHLKIEAGAVFARTFIWRDEADAPINLTGYVAHMALVVKGVLIADWSPHFLIDGPTGTVILTVPATETPLAKPAGTYNIELTPPSGPAGTVRFLQGQWSVSADAYVAPAPPPLLSYQDRIVADGAIAYWPLDDPAGSTTARDVVGTRTGTLIGLVTPGVPGEGNAQAMRFDSGYIIITPSLPNMPVITLELWTSADPAILNNNLYLFARDGLDNYGYSGSLRLLGMADGINDAGDAFVTYIEELKLYLDRYHRATGVPADGMLPNTWHHLVSTFDGATVLLYRDGVLVKSGTFSDTWEDDVSAVYETVIGAMPSDPSYTAYVGLIQDVAVYASVLTPEQILDHYQARVPAVRRAKR